MINDATLFTSIKMRISTHIKTLCIKNIYNKIDFLAYLSFIIKAPIIIPIAPSPTKS